MINTFLNLIVIFSLVFVSLVAQAKSKNNSAFWETRSINFVELNKKRYGDNSTKKKKITKKKKALKSSDSVSTKNAALAKNKRKRRKQTTIIQNVSTTQPAKPAFREYTEKINFNYFVQFLGPSLSQNYQQGATFNRFKTGQDWKGDEMDATGSHQMFHAVSIGYRLSQNLNLFYGYTFQDDINKDITYRVKNLDGSFTEYERPKGVSDNNKRLNLQVGNIINNEYIYFGNTFFYEFASTVSSESEDREYGLGMMPTLTFSNGIRGLYTGINGLIQRNYFKRQQYDTTCINSFTGTSYTCPIPTRYQTLLVEISPYVNYALNDYITLRSQLTFDWDQQGDQVDSTAEYNKNMADVGRLGVDFNIDYGVVAGTFIEFGLEEASLDKTAIGATLSLSLY